MNELERLNADTRAVRGLLSMGEFVPSAGDPSVYESEIVLRVPPVRVRRDEIGCDPGYNAARFGQRIGWAALGLADMALAAFSLDEPPACAAPLHAAQLASEEQTAGRLVAANERQADHG